MWIRTQIGNLVNMDNVGSVGVEEGFDGGFSVKAAGVSISISGSDVGRHEITLFEGTKEACDGVMAHLSEALEEDDSLFRHRNDPDYWG